MEHAGAEVSSFPSSDLSFLQKQKEEDFASIPSCLEESPLINCLTEDLETLSSYDAQVTLATESSKKFNKTCHYCEDLQGEERKKNYSWERCIFLYLHYFQTEIFQDEAKMVGWGVCVFVLVFILIFISPGSGNFVSLQL